MPLIQSLVHSPVGWLVPAAGLLAVPGPTNTLMATTGACVGVSRSLPLITAEIVGYIISITFLVLVFGPIIATSPVLSLGLKLACGAYLAYSAFRLWRMGSADPSCTPERPITYRQVLLTTLLNPKAMVFAFMIIPFREGKSAGDFIGLLTLFASAVVVMATGWILAGALTRTSLSRSSGRIDVTRISAVVLGFFSAGLIMSAVR